MITGNEIQTDAAGENYKGKIVCSRFFLRTRIGTLFDQAQNLTALRSMENYLRESETPR
jgi:hypothetical protein